MEDYLPRELFDALDEFGIVLDNKERGAMPSSPRRSSVSLVKDSKGGATVLYNGDIAGWIEPVEKTKRKNSWLTFRAVSVHGELQITDSIREAQNFIFDVYA